MKHRILVTGASGFVGKALVKNALENGMVVNLSSRQSLTSTHLHQKYFLAEDLSPTIDWKSELKDVLYVVHCAGRVHVKNDKESDPLAIFRKINVGGTLNLARQAAASGVKRFVFISTIGVNGPQTKTGAPFKEVDEPQPHNAYAISKLEAEKGLFDIAKSTGMDIVVIRPPLVYGYKAPGNFGLLMRVLLRGWPLPFGGIKNLRSFVALDVLVDFILTCLAHPNAANQIFLVSDDHDVSTSELLISLTREAGMPCHLLPVPMWFLKLCSMIVGKRNMMLSLCGNLQLDISKARNVLGWRPPFSFNEGIRRAVNKGDTNNTFPKKYFIYK
jgi:nucleoside-diphosphate-sugar epimerase